MGYKWPKNTTPAQRRMLRAIELNPGYRPIGPRAKTRYQRLIDRGHIKVNRKDKTAKVVFPKA